MSCAGKEITWRRDSVDMFAFHLEIPEGHDSLDISLDYLSPAEANGTRERPASTAKLLVLNWYVVALYPQGANTDNLTYVPSIQLPAGWKYGTALQIRRAKMQAKCSSLRFSNDSYRFPSDCRAVHAGHRPIARPAT